MRTRRVHKQDLAPWVMSINSVCTFAGIVRNEYFIFAVAPLIAFLSAVLLQAQRESLEFSKIVRCFMRGRSICSELSLEIAV